MSANIQEVESPTRKRSHDEYQENSYQGPDMDKKADKKPPTTRIEPDAHQPETATSQLPTLTTNPPPGPPGQSSPASLTDAGSSTPACNSPSPNTPTRPASHLAGNVLPASSSLSSLAPPVPASGAPPPAKKTRLTPHQKAAGDQSGGLNPMREQTEAAKKLAREQARAAKQAEKEAKDKAEAEKKMAREAARAAKAQENAERKAQRDAEREEKQRRKEEEARKAQEEKEKKERSQMRLNSFFKSQGPSIPVEKAHTAVVTPKESPGAAKDGAAEAAAVSDYDKMFKAFFVKDNVRVAHGKMDEETKEVKTKILDEYVREERGAVNPVPFDPVASLHLPARPAPRGRTYPNVRHIMGNYNGGASGVRTDLTTESENARIQQVRSQLRTVPMKFLGFREDVRPAYYGTVTSADCSHLRKLARRPISKTLLPLNYDYDSEAEWQDDDGEDLDDMDDSEDDLDVDEDMGEFLDDSEDAGVARPLFAGAMQPDSSGICWEDYTRSGPKSPMYKYRLEFILDNLDHQHGIDPFSSQYWEPAGKKRTGAEALAGSEPNGPKSSATSAPPNMAPPPAPSDAAQVLMQAGTSKKVPLAPQWQHGAFKEKMNQYAHVSKIGLVELLHSELNITKAQAKATIERMYDHVGSKKNNKRWMLKSEFEET